MFLQDAFTFSMAVGCCQPPHPRGDAPFTQIKEEMGGLGGFGSRFWPVLQMTGHSVICFEFLSQRLHLSFLQGICSCV